MTSRTTTVDRATGLAGLSWRDIERWSGLVLRLVVGFSMITTSLVVVQPTLSDLINDFRAQLEANADATTAAAAASAAANGVPEGLTPQEWSDIQSQIAGSVDAVTSAPTMVAGGLTASVTDMLDVRGRTGVAQFSATAFGTTGSISELAPVSGTLSTDPSSGVETATFDRIVDGVAVSEWYRTTAAGIEQGFTIDALPSGATSSELIVDISVASLLGETTAAHVTPEFVNADEIALVNGRGQTSFWYRDLYAFDANGVDLPAAMSVVDGQIRLTVDAVNAVFPVTIDPLVTEDQALSPIADAAGNSLGEALALDDDAGAGSLVVVGSRFADDRDLVDGGSVTLYRLPVPGASTAALEQTIFGDQGSEFGAAIDVVDTRLVVGAPADDTNGSDSGTVFVYDFDGATWNLTFSLFECDAAGGPCGDSAAGTFAGSRFGTSVALSDDGATIVVGAPSGKGDDGGAAYVYTQATPVDPFVTNLEGDLFRSPNYSTAGAFGWDVAITGPVGNQVVVVGGPGDEVGNDVETGGISIFGWDGTTSAIYDQISGTTLEGGLGASVAAAVEPNSGRVLVIAGAPGFSGVPGDTDLGAAPGEVFVIDVDNTGGFDNGVLTGPLQTLTGTAGEAFGQDVAFDGITLLAGQPLTSFGADVIGSYGRFEWNFPLQQMDGLPTGLGAFATLDDGDRIGDAVAVDGDRIAFGGPGFDASEPGFGPDQDKAAGTDAGAFFVGGNPIAGDPFPISRTEPEVTADGDRFGHDVAISGDRMAVSAFRDEEGSTNAGAVYMYERIDASSPWVLFTVIADPTPSDFGEFGAAIALNGDVLAISDSGENDSLVPGTVAVYHRNDPGTGFEWTFRQAIAPSLQNGTDFFGTDIAVTQDGSIIVSAPGSNALVINAGAVFGFSPNGTFTTWVQEFTQGALTPSPGGGFGDFIDIDETGPNTYTLAVGSSGTAGFVDANVEILTGTTFGGQPTQASLTTFAASDDLSGVAVSGDRFVATGVFGPTFDRAVVYVDALGTPTVEEVLTDVVGTPTAVALDEGGARLIVGTATVLDSRGEIRVFERSGTSWTQVQDGQTASTVDSDEFGFAVALDGDTLMVGAPGADAGADAGEVFSFNIGEDLPVTVAAIPNLALVGVPNQDTVYLLGQDAAGVWTNIDTFTGPAGSEYGTAVAFDESTFNEPTRIVIGAPGAGFVEQRDWNPVTETYDTPVATLAALVGIDADARFGASVAAFFGATAIGAPLHDGADGADTGAVVYIDAGGVDKILDRGNPGDLVGTSVAMTFGTVFAGAPTQTNAGIVYRITNLADAFPTFDEIDLGATGASGDEFGAAISFGASGLIIGAPGRNSDQGEVYRADNTTPVFIASGGGAGVRLGEVVTALGDRLSLVQGGSFINFSDNGDEDTFNFVGNGTPASAPQDQALAGSQLLSALQPTGAVTSGLDVIEFSDFIVPGPPNKVTTDDPEAGAFFGVAVELEGDILVAADATPFPGNIDYGTYYSPEVSVFSRSGATWTEQQQLTDALVVVNGSDQIGFEGDTIVVNNRNGGLDVWTRPGAGNPFTVDFNLDLGPILGANFDRAADVIVLEDDVLALGMPVINDDGAVVVFTGDPSTWASQTPQVLVSDTPVDSERFGDTIAIDTNSIIIGAPATNLAQPGSAELFIRPDGASPFAFSAAAVGTNNGDRFGGAVAIGDGSIAIGAPFDDSLATDSGGVDIFDATTFAPTGNIPSPSNVFNFGSGLDIDQGRLIVGVRPDTTTANTATAYVYDLGSLGLTDTLAAADFESQDPGRPGNIGTDGYQAAVALSGGTAVVGNAGDQAYGTRESGAVYAFQVATPDDPTIAFQIDVRPGSDDRVPVAPAGIATSEFSAEQIEEASNSTVAASPLSAIDLEDTPLSAIAVGDTPLAAIVADSQALGRISLIDISVEGGWEAILAGSDLENVPLVDLTFDDVVTNASASGNLASTPLSAIDVAGTPLSAIPLSAIVLGELPLSAIPLSAIGEDWCAVVQPFLVDVTCTDETDLTDVTLMEATLRGVPLSAIPLSAIPLSAIDITGTPLSAIPLSAIELEASPLSAIPLSAIDVGSTPLSAIPLSAIPLSAIPLSAIPLSAIDVDGTPLSAIPLSAIPLSAIPLSAIPLSAIPLSAIEPESTPLSAIPLSAIALADVPLSAIPLSAIDGSTVDWCDLLADIGNGVDCDRNVDPSTTTLQELTLQGVPLSAIPLSAIPLSAIPLSAIPLSAIPLSAIPLSAIPLSAIPLSAIPLSAIDVQGTPLSAIDPSATPLSAIPLSAIPLSAIDVQGSPLSAIPLSAINVAGTDLATTPLSAIPLSAIPLSAIPLSAIDVAGTPLSAIPLSAIDVNSTPLSAIPLSAIPLAAIGVDCGLVDCENGTLGEALQAGALPASTPLSAIDDALDGIFLNDLAFALLNATVTDVEAGVDGSGLELGDYTTFGNLTLGDLPDNLAAFLTLTLGDLDDGLWVAEFDDLIGALIDPGTGQPFDEAVVEATLRTLIDNLSLDFGDLDALGGVTLGELLEEGTVNGTLSDLEPVLELIKVQDLLDALVNASANVGGDTLGDVFADVALDLGDLTLADLAEEGITDFDSLDLGQLLQILIDAGLIDGYTLADLLLALVDPSQLPFSTVDFTDVDPAALPDSAVGTIGLRALARVQETTFAQSIEVDTRLPGSASYVVGSAVVTIDDGANPPSVISLEPAIDGDVLTWSFDGVNADVDYTIDFDVKPGLDLGPEQVRSRGRIVGTDTETRSTVNIGVVEGLEPNDFPDVTPIQEDLVYLTYISSQTDNDVFSIDLLENDRLAISLSALSEDFDVALYVDPTGAGNAALTDVSAEDVLIPVANPDQNGVDAEPLEDFRRLDQIDSNLEFLQISNSEGTETEVISTDRLEAGRYYIQVFGANGARSPEPAALQVQVTEAETSPVCIPLGALPGATPGVAPALGGTTANTLFLINEQRIEQLYSATERADVIAALDDLVAYLQANPQLGIDPIVVPVDGFAEVRNAYAAWDNPAVPADACQPETANAVVSEIIENVIDPLRAQLDHVVVIGGDQLIPQARLADATTVANEYEYRHEFSGDLLGPDANGQNAFTSFAWQSTYLSDEPYGDSQARDLGERYLYVADLALGRLVEEPAEIISSLETFVTFNGELDVSTGAVLGYDFLVDGSEEIAADLADAGVAVDDELADGLDATGNAWTQGDAADILAPASGNSPGLISLNAHFDHYRALPAAGDQVPGFSDNLLSTTILTAAPSSVLDGSIVFSMGCHSGLSVSDIQIGATSTDWAQTFASQGATYIGNTGFGYGDTEAVAYSERLMALFAERAVDPLLIPGQTGPTTIGQAMQFAKNEYVADLGSFSVYDEKALMEATFYGLPFYRVNLAPTPAPAPPDNVTVSDATGTEILSVNIDPTNDANVTPSGTYYSNPDDEGDEQVISSPGRPIQPKLATDISVVDQADSTVLGQIAHGAFVIGLTSDYLSPVDPVVSSVVFDESSEQPEPELGNVAFPAKPLVINNTTEPGGQRQTLVVATGKYFSASETQRLDEDIDVTVFYADPSETDFVAPQIGRVESTLADGLLTVSMNVGDRDGVVDRVFVLVAENPGPGATVEWRGLDLSPVSGDRWAGSLDLTPGTTRVEFLVQAKDDAGNVGFSSNKARDFSDDGTTGTPVVPTIDLDVDVDNGNLDAGSGWYTGDVTVTVTSDTDNPAEVSVDGGPFQPVPASGEITITGDGIHTFQVTTADGQSESGTIRIDTTGAPELLVGVPVLGASYANDVPVSFDFLCRDPSLETCSAAVGGVPVQSGDALPTTPGNYIFTISATDALGNTDSRTIGFDVTAPVSSVPEIQLLTGPTTPDDIANAATIVVDFADADGTADDYTVTFDWGDGIEGSPGTSTVCTTSSGAPTTGNPSCEISSEPNGAAAGSATGSFTYAEPGVYAVTVTVTDSVGNTDSSVYEFIVVFDPSGGRVSGAGWYWSGPEAYDEGPAWGSPAYFGFRARYRNNEDTPRGRTNLHLLGQFFFKSTGYDYLIVNDTMAVAEGTGKINNESGYRMRVQAIDNGWTDYFQITIWDDATGEVIYDNGLLYEEGDRVLIGGIRIRGAS